MLHRVALAAVLLAVGGCGKSDPVLPQPSAAVSGAEYFPLTAGNVWSYDSVLVLGSVDPEKRVRAYELSEQEKEEDAADPAPVFLLEEQGRGILNAMVMVYGVREGSVVTWRGFAGMAKTAFDPPFVELPALIEPGGRWSWSGSTRGVEVAITSRLEGLERVAVPGGVFDDCLRISRSLPMDGKVTHWYAKGRGLVKMAIQRPAGGLAPSSTETWELTSASIR